MVTNARLAHCCGGDLLRTDLGRKQARRHKRTAFLAVDVADRRQAPGRLRLLISRSISNLARHKLKILQVPNYLKRN